MVKETLRKAIANALLIAPENVRLERAPSFTGADFAMAAKKDKAQDAGEIKKCLEIDKEIAALVSKIEVKGMFVNFFLSPELLGRELHRILGEKNQYGSSEEGKGETIVVDYSGPNVAKRFSVGHLRSSVIGQALYNLYAFLGYKVIGDNHLGDWGTQFGIIIAQIVRKDLDAKKLTVEDLEQLYVEFNKEMIENPALREEAKSWFKKLEDGDTRARSIWQIVVATSMKEFEKIYDLLDIHIDHAYGESFYEDKMPAVIKELEKKGLITDSQGARVVEVGENMPSAIIIKSDGTTTYFLRDLATTQFRLNEWHPERIVYEVGSDQILHFRQLFAAEHLLGWDKGVEFKHVAHGLIRFKEGKMSTRKGQTIKLEDVLNEAIKRAREIIDLSETARGLSEKEKEEVAKAVGIGAVKYFDLSHNPASDILFEWEKLFQLEGNSAPYLQYTNARIQSLLKKGGTADSQVTEETVEEAEAALLRAMIHFPDAVKASADQYAPNLLCNFLFELAQGYNNFYSKCRVLGSERETFRLQLSKAVGSVIQSGLSLLGIKAPERM